MVCKYYRIYQTVITYFSHHIVISNAVSSEIFPRKAVPYGKMSRHWRSSLAQKCPNHITTIMHGAGVPWRGIQWAQHLLFVINAKGSVTQNRGRDQRCGPNVPNNNSIFLHLKEVPLEPGSTIYQKHAAWGQG